MPNANAKGGPPFPPPKGRPLVPPGLNQPPVAHDDTFTLNEDTSLSGNLLADNGFGADTDPNAGDLISIVGAGIYATVQGGTIEIDLDGRFTYMPPADFHGIDSFRYSIRDAGGLTATATALFNVEAQDDAPAISLEDRFQQRHIVEDGPQHLVRGVVHFSDPDADDRPTASVVSRVLTSPDHATIKIITLAGETTLFDGSVIDALSAQAQNALRGFTIHPDSDNTNEGAVNWSYSVADQALQFLSEGGSAILTATIEVDDQHGATDRAQVQVRLEGRNDVPVFLLDGNPAFSPFDGVPNYTFMFGGPGRQPMPSTLPAPDAYIGQVNGNNLHFEGFFYFTDPDIFDLHSVEAHPLSPLIPPWGSYSVEIAVTGTNINAIPRYNGQLSGDSIVDGLGIVHFTYDAAIPAGGFLDPFRITLHDFFGGQSQLDVFIGVPPPLVTPPPIPVVFPPPEFIV